MFLQALAALAKNIWSCHTPMSNTRSIQLFGTWLSSLIIRELVPQAFPFPFGKSVWPFRFVSVSWVFFLKSSFFSIRRNNFSLMAQELFVSLLCFWPLLMGFRVRHHDAWLPKERSPDSGLDWLTMKPCSTMVTLGTTIQFRFLGNYFFRF
jgi:hypothetical protein